MDWLTQNWVWLALALGVGSYLLRGGLGGRAGAHGGVLGGTGHGGHAGAGGHGGHGGQPEERTPADAPQEHARNATGHPVRPLEAANERPRRRGGCC